MFRSLIAGRFALSNTPEPPQPVRPANIATKPPTPNVVNPVDDSPTTPVTLIEYAQQKERAGLLVTRELDLAFERVKRNVEEIASECRARNSKFR